MALNITMQSAETFYQNNKSCSWKPTKIPEDLVSNEEIAKWIFAQPIGWIELDLTIDLDQWLIESTQALPYLVDHREGENHLGWTSACIHGLGTTVTGTNFNEPVDAYHWTELSEITPTIKAFWESLPFEKLLRVRFMSVDSAGYVGPHNDNPNVDNILDHIIPINIAIFHPRLCYMTLRDHGVVPWNSGKAILVNITNDHSVINYSKQRRLHMIGHGLIGSKKNEFYELIVRSYKKQYELSK
jgi:hypothetical protein